MLEQKCLSLIGWKHTQRIFDVSTNVGVFFWFGPGRHCTLDHIGRGSKAKLPPSLSGRIGPALVDNYLVKPASETIRFPAAAQATKSTHESGLERIVRVYPRSKHSHCKANACVLMTPNQAGECFDVPSEDGCNEVCIRGSLHK
jgi:hypothetical protein